MEHITYSRLRVAKECLRKHFYMYELCVRKERKGDALWIGKIFHECLEAGKPVKRPPYPAWCLSFEDRFAWDLNHRKAVELAQGYMEYWEDDAIEPVANEVAFDLPLINPDTDHASTNYRIAGKIDCIGKLPDGRLAVVERKTKSDSLEPDSPLWKTLILDAQLSMYMLAARAMGHDVQTVIYDVAKRPGIRPIIVKDADPEGRMKNNKGKPLETVDEYGERLAAKIKEDPEKVYARQEIPRMDADLDEFAHELWAQQKMLSECKNKGYWYRNTAQCTAFFQCEYLDVCRFGFDLSGGIPLGFEHTDQHPELEGGESE